ncbi:MAG: hypothetical protein JRF55_03020 [Deltaproteobacteria bacterium]|nr:hypothetical protein [Deltaproteobacteria bacterium]
MTTSAIEEVIRIQATPEAVRQCILSADRILQYYPMGDGAERLKRAAMFSMLEDWHLEDDAGATKLTRLWRDFERHRLAWLPVEPLVRVAAKLESFAIKKHWATR